MIEKKTVLILGAGASKPYGFPLGFELRDSVIRKSKSWSLYRDRFNTPFNEDQYAEFTDDLAHAGFSSVDAFLEVNHQWLDIGKSAIALELLINERSCMAKMFPPNQPKDHWYEALWGSIRAPSWSLFKKNQLSIITFNYDRSLEHYLVNVLCKTYKIGPRVAAEGLEKMPLLHVHGELGPYISRNREPDFGDSLSEPRWKVAARGIRIVHEKTERTRDFIAARRQIAQAERILFIGFAYHPLNMAKLGLGDIHRIGGLGPFRAFGTHTGIKTQTWRRVCHRYGFSSAAVSQGSGRVTDFVKEWMT